LKIGKYEVSIIREGSIGLDGGAMFGVVPKALWSKTNPADERNRVELATQLLLLKSDSKIILIDTGVGQSWDEKFEDIYRVDHSVFSLEDSLTKAGVSRNEITDVILTHLHFDHVGGSLMMENGKFVPTFPNATYHVQVKHLEWALSPADKDKASFIRDRFLPLAEHGVLHGVDGATQFDDEIELILDHGHTFYQQIVKISDGNQTLFHTGDMMPFSSHIPIPYVMAYDIMPMETIKAKKITLKKAFEEEWRLFFQHDPFTPVATITETEKGFRAKEKFTEII